ncbi:ribbon-helix-helix protein, CopG family [Candidatus Shapirobacteria bacterium]|nr:ribbon-helix-helix protein, CopG family [Candidatus Shapirobacteria bacterium]
MGGLEPVTQYRTQLYLPASLYQQIREKTREEDISLAEYIRRLIRKELDKSIARDKLGRDRAWREFLQAAGIAKGGPRDLARNHDKYLKVL